MLRRARVKRTRSGTFKLDLPVEERRVVRSLLEQLRQLLGEEQPDERVRRLFPTVYPHDAQADAEYQRLMRDELVSSRLGALETVEASLEATSLTEDQMVAWMASINAVRLVLGTMLDIGEELDLDVITAEDPDVESYVLYSYLSGLLDDMVRAVQG